MGIHQGWCCCCCCCCNRATEGARWFMPALGLTYARAFRSCRSASKRVRASWSPAIPIDFLQYMSAGGIALSMRAAPCPKQLTYGRPRTSKNDWVASSQSNCTNTDCKAGSLERKYSRNPSQWQHCVCMAQDAPVLQQGLVHVVLERRSEGRLAHTLRCFPHPRLHRSVCLSLRLILEKCHESQTQRIYRLS